MGFEAAEIVPRCAAGAADHGADPEIDQDS
jgi:hypothetical protein